MSNPLLPSQTHTHVVQDTRNYRLQGTTAPLPTDGDNLGFNNGSIWIDTNALPEPIAYICVDATFPNAIWQPIGDATVAQVPINRTFFVDAQFGTAGGVPQDLRQPFQTLAQALAAAAPNNGDVIYVQPGTYSVATPLTLKDGVQWYFSEGAIVESSGTALFDDASGSVVCNMSGFGAFTVMAGGDALLRTTNASSVAFFARTIESQSGLTSALFDLSNTVAATPSRYSIEVDSVVQTLAGVLGAPRSVLQIGVTASVNAIDVLLEAQSIVGLNVVRALAGATGNCDIEVQTIDCGESSIDGDNLPLGALFYNATDAYAIRVACQNLHSRSSTQMAIATNPTATPATPTITVSAQTLEARGGLIYAQGFDNTASAELQPRVEVYAADITILGPLVGASLYPVFCSHSWVVVRSTTYVNERVDTRYNFTVEDLGRLFVDVRRMLLTASKAFNVSNLDPSTGVTTLVVDAGDITAIDSLFLVDNECRLTVTARQLMCSTAIVGQSAIVTQGVVAQPPPMDTLLATTTIETDLLWLTATGTDGTDSGRASMINHTAGMLNLIVNTYGVTGSFYNAIRVGPGLNVNNVRINLCGIIAADSRFLFLDGTGPGTACAVDCDTLAGGLTDGGAGTTIIDLLDGRVSGHINGIILGGDANANGVLLRGNAQYAVTTMQLQVLFGAAVGINAQDNGSVFAQINGIGTDSGSVIRSTSNGNVDIVFQNMDGRNASRPLDFQGPGDAHLSGVQLSSQNSNDLIFIGNQANVSLMLQNINANQTGTVVRLEIDGSLYLEFQTLYANDVSVAAFHGTNGNSMRINGQEMGINQQTTPPTAIVFHLEGQNNVSLQCHNINCNNLVGFVYATEVTTPFTRRSSAQLQFSTFYGNELEYIVFADTASQILMSFQEINVNSISTSAFTADGGNTALHLSGLSLSGGSNVPTPGPYFNIPNTTSNGQIIANINDINIFNGAFASLAACYGGGFFQLRSMRVRINNVIRLLDIQNSYSLVSVGDFQVNQGTFESDSLIIADNSTLRIESQNVIFGDPQSQTLFRALNSGTLQVVVDNLEAYNTCGHIVHTSDNSRIRFDVYNIDVNGANTGAFLFESNNEALLRFGRLRVSSNPTGAEFLECDNGRISFSATQIDLGDVDSLLTLSNVFNSVVEWGDCAIPIRNNGIVLTDSFVTFDCARTDFYMAGASAPVSAFVAAGNSTATGNFGYFGSAMVGFETQDTAQLDVAVQRISTVGNCLWAKSTGATNFLPSYAVAGGGLAVVYINVPSPGTQITVGGSFDVPSSQNAIVFDTASQAPNLSLMSSKLISAAESIYSPTTAVTVSAVPSSVRFLPNVNVTVIPTNALFDDAGLF
jgi:hypothetical protein